MIKFTFTDASGTVLWVSRQQPTEQCGGGCCFDKAVHDFRANIMPNFVPGQTSGVEITVGV